MVTNEQHEEKLTEHETWVLIIDADARIRTLLYENLKDYDFEVDAASSGEEGLNNSLSKSYDMILMDINLPNMDGLELIKKIRAEKNTPIMILTENNEEYFRLQSFENGVDDYITKPFNLKEIKLRIKAILRRFRTNIGDVYSKDQSQIISLPPIEIDNNSRLVTVMGKPVNLTPREFDLLYYFMSSPDQIFGREQLLREVWHYEFLGDLRTVDTHIKRLREKLKKQSFEASKMIETVWGLGYRLNTAQE